jgi:hypothetical protein
MSSSDVAYLQAGCDVTSLESSYYQPSALDLSHEYFTEEKSSSCDYSKEKSSSCDEKDHCVYINAKECFIDSLKEKAYHLHKQLAKEITKTDTYIESNGDIHSIKDYAANFTKGFSHDRKGRVDKKEYEKLIAFTKGDFKQLEKIKRGGDRKFVNPSCLYGVDIVGMPKESFWLPAAPSIKSKDGSAELIELYGMALVRDIPFYAWKDSKEVHWVIDALNKLSHFWGPKVCGKVTVDTLFRGETKGDLIGPYVSQFLLREVTFGALKLSPKVYAYLAGKDYMTTYEECLYIQNGHYPKHKAETHACPRYIHTLRDGTSYIHQDYPGQFGLTSAQFLLGLGVPITAQYKCSNEDYFVELAQCDLFDCLHKASKLSMCAAWYQKWTQLKIRPEGYAMLVDEAKNSGCNPYHLDKELLESPLLEKVKYKWGSYLLPQCYPEGSPLHPSYPSGHATWAGAVTTILKAFFDNDYELDAYEAACGGEQLVSLGYKVKVGDELDKLASNGGSFRNVAGIHYRSDMLGIYLGEAVAIELLQECVQRYGYPVKFEFRARNGKKVVIDNYKS